MLRFAPSPTGDMHIGNLRAAVFNYIVSKQLKDDLLIRIEDTDKERNIDGKDKEILELLTIFSLDYKNVFYQSQNLKYHQKLALQLMSQKKAFACFCTDERLEQLKEKCIKEGKPFRYDGFCEHLSDHEVVNSNKPFTVRIKKPLESIKFTDLLKGDFEYAAFDIDSFILLRQDKTPTYNFACSVDDMIMNISTVIRGEDHVSNTPRQIHVRNSLNYTKNINYVHLPIILNAQTGKKMSKRDNESSVKWLINEGYLPSAIANYLVLLGNKTQKEIFTLEEAIEWFKIESISKSAAKFDIDKLKFINRKHIENIDVMRLSKILGFADNDIGSLAKLFLEEASTIKEIKEKIGIMFSEKNVLIDYELEFNLIKESIKKAGYFDSFDELKTYISKDVNLSGKKLLKPLRYLLTGSENGPNLSDIYPFIKNYLGDIIK